MRTENKYSNLFACVVVLFVSLVCPRNAQADVCFHLIGDIGLTAGSLGTSTTLTVDGLSLSISADVGRINRNSANGLGVDRNPTDGNDFDDVTESLTFSVPAGAMITEIELTNWRSGSGDQLTINGGPIFSASSGLGGTETITLSTPTESATVAFVAGNGFRISKITATAVPEPSAFLCVAGCCVLIGLRRSARRRRCARQRFQDEE